MSEEPPMNPSPEVVQSPEELMRGLTERVDRGLSELGVPPRNERNWGWCNFVPDAVNYCAVIDGEERGYEVMSAKYQVRNLHIAAAGEGADIAQVRKTTFGHGCNVVSINGEPFLLDLTFSQFIGEDGTLSNQANHVSSGIPNDNPLAQQLLRDGFFPLNNENLQTYMRFLCTHEPEYLQYVTTDLLDLVTEMPFAMDDNELMDRIPPAYGGTATRR